MCFLLPAPLPPSFLQRPGHQAHQAVQALLRPVQPSQGHCRGQRRSDAQDPVRPLPLLHVPLPLPVRRHVAAVQPGVQSHRVQESPGAYPVRIHVLSYAVSCNKCRTSLPLRKLHSSPYLPSHGGRHHPTMYPPCTRCNRSCLPFGEDAGMQLQMTVSVCTCHSATNVSVMQLPNAPQSSLANVPPPICLP